MSPEFKFLMLTAFVWPLSGQTVLSGSVQDEELRLRILGEVFPGTMISRQSPDVPNRERDALAQERLYRVRGAALSEVEECASEDVASRQKSVDRNLRSRIIVLGTGTKRSFIAVMQYEFAGVEPGGACWSIGMVARITELGGRGLSVRGQYLFETQHHTSIRSIRIMDLSGDGQDHLVVESNWGGAGVAGASFYIFDLRNAPLRPIFIGRSEENGEAGITSAQIDVARTRLRRANSICLVRKTDFDPNRKLSRPRISRPCYPAGFGVSANSETQDWLRKR